MRMSEMPRLVLAVAVLLFAASIFTFAVKWQPEAHAASATATGEIGMSAWVNGGSAYAIVWNTSSGESVVYRWADSNGWVKVEFQLPKNPLN